MRANGSGLPAFDSLLGWRSRIQLDTFRRTDERIIADSVAGIRAGSTAW